MRIDSQIITPISKVEINEYYQIRFEELREPWGQPVGSEKDSIENKCVHRMLMVDEGYVGVARLQYNSKFQAQIRYMAVRKKYQMQGFGKILLVDLENIAKQNGSNEIILQSREIALPFYLSSNYKVVEKTHLLFNNIQHFLMRKYL